MRTYEVTICPLCGEQLERDEMYGDGECSTHGKTALVTVEVVPAVPFEPRAAWLVRNGIWPRWELTDPRTQDYGAAPTPRVLKEFHP